MTSMIFVACSKSSDTQADDEPTWYEQIYFNITRADSDEVADNTTYNFTLFGGTDGNTSYSGTYRVPTSDENTSILYPCEVNPSTGAIVEDGAFDSSCGLSAPAGSYQIVVVSQAVAVSTLKSDHTGAERKGFEINRHIADSNSDADIYIKGPRDVSVSGVEIGGSKEYTSSEADLCRPRSKFVLHICCEDEDAEGTWYDVYDVYFENILSTGYYNPTVGYYRAEGAIDDNFRPYGDVTPFKAVAEPKTMEVNSDNQTTIDESDFTTENAFYLIANDCSGGESTYVAVPNLKIRLNRNANEDEENNATLVTIPLEYEFKRSYYYEFTITISPIGITLSGIAVEEWTEVSGGDITVENLSSIVFEWADVGDWEEGEGGNVTFGD